MPSNDTAAYPQDCTITYPWTSFHLVRDTVHHLTPSLSGLLCSKIFSIMDLPLKLRRIAPPRSLIPISHRRHGQDDDEIAYFTMRWETTKLVLYTAPKTWDNTDKDSNTLSCLVLSVSAAWTELTTRRDSFASSRPSFQFATVQSQI